MTVERDVWFIFTVHNTVFCTEVWLLVPGGMFLLIADITSCQLAIY